MAHEQSRSILSPDRIQWLDPDETRLDYKKIFESHHGESESRKHEKMAARLMEREKEWEARLEKVRIESYQLGLKEGHRKGTEEEKQRLRPVLAEIQSGLKAQEKEAQTRWHVIEKEIVDLAFLLAECVLEVQVENSGLRKRLERSLAYMLSQLQDRTRPRLVVHPEDLSPISDLIDELDLRASLRLEEDEGFRRGEYRIETGKETLVATYEALLGELKQSLSGAE